MPINLELKQNEEFLDEEASEGDDLSPEPVEVSFASLMRNTSQELEFLFSFVKKINPILTYASSYHLQFLVNDILEKNIGIGSISIEVFLKHLARVFPSFVARLKAKLSPQYREGGYFAREELFSKLKNGNKRNTQVAKNEDESEAQEGQGKKRRGRRKKAVQNGNGNGARESVFRCAPDHLFSFCFEEYKKIENPTPHQYLEFLSQFIITLDNAKFLVEHDKAFAPIKKRFFDHILSKTVLNQMTENISQLFQQLRSFDQQVSFLMQCAMRFNEVHQYEKEDTVQNELLWQFYHSEAFDGVPDDARLQDILVAAYQKHLNGIVEAAELVLDEANPSPSDDEGEKMEPAEAQDDFIAQATALLVSSSEDGSVYDFRASLETIFNEIREQTKETKDEAFQSVGAMIRALPKRHPIKERLLQRYTQFIPGGYLEEALLLEKLCNGKYITDELITRHFRREQGIKQVFDMTRKVKTGPSLTPTIVGELCWKEFKDNIENDTVAEVMLGVDKTGEVNATLNLDEMFNPTVDQLLEFLRKFKISLDNARNLSDRHVEFYKEKKILFERKPRDHVIDTLIPYITKWLEYETSLSAQIRLILMFARQIDAINESPPRANALVLHIIKQQETLTMGLLLPENKRIEDYLGEYLNGAPQADVIDMAAWKQHGFMSKQGSRKKEGNLSQEQTHRLVSEAKL